MMLRTILDVYGGRTRAHKWIDSADDGTICELKPPGKSRDQEKRYHAMIGDLAKQWKFCDRTWDKEDMKRLCLDQFRRDTIKDPEFVEEWRKVDPIEMAPSIDGSGVVALGVQSRRLTKKLASGFCDWLCALGAERGVIWSDPTTPPME